MQRLFSRSTSCNRKKTFFFVFFFMRAQCYLCAYSAAIYVGAVLLICAQCYLSADSAICARKWLSVRVQCICMRTVQFICVERYLCGYLCTYSAFCVRTVLLVSLQCYLCAWDSIFVCWVLFMCKQFYLCTYSNIKVPYMRTVLFMYVAGAEYVKN